MYLCISFVAVLWMAREFNFIIRGKTYCLYENLVVIRWLEFMIFLFALALGVWLIYETWIRRKWLDIVVKR